MWLYFCKRLLAMIPTLLGVLTLTFLVTQFVPGGPVESSLSRLDSESARSGVDGGAISGGWSYSGRAGIDAQQIEQMSQQFGFDRPLLDRYLHMLASYLRFDLGESYVRNDSVWALIQAKLGVSVSLGVWTFLLTYLISVPLGVAKAVRAGSRFDFLTSLLILTGYAVPGFVLGVLLLVLFGGGSFWDVFPLRGLTSDNWDELSPLAKLGDYLWHIALPVTASVVSTFALKTLLTKNTFLEEIRRQYVLTARAKGLSERRVLWKHVLRNALLPLVTGFPGAFIAAFFTGSLLIETLFSLDGLGLLSYESINSRDYPVVLGSLYLLTLIGLITKLIGDIAYVLVDPRIKFDARTA
ncbi:ABC transporter permease subunit [Pseudomonas aeruginosa]|uniref:ABC transporter permease subunit n=1 Tax=Pseudomonas aeruginosa TaxID=287 RepID=UPI001557D28F|nr:ABC transporter permease subunit [Pseudomonas aeruginosa]QKF01593.1 ABC transporter permease subunit [Pseudomonas aeruginosa]HCF1525266.1 ABC transporter permease subunit [Pseudomonas aeruginosa]HEP8866707.1 ABC transporter permease subunit [Pseudomonas aeruginosa]